MDTDPIEEWFAWLEHDRQRSPNTIATYRRTLKTLPNAPTATREDVETWWATRAATGLAAASRNNELAALRSFYKWAARFEHRPDDPTIRLDPVKTGARVSRFVGKDDLTLMLETFPPDLRRAVALGSYAGCRISESAQLHWSHINQETRRITVLGKGDKERVVGLPVQLLDILLPDTGGFVVTGAESTVSPHTLQLRLNRAMRAAGIQGSSHQLRHRFGFKSAAAGVAPTSIARAMGHASLTTTMGYVAAVDSDLDLIGEAAVS